MRYETYKVIMSNRNAFLMPYNSATGTSTDTTVDATITRDPNDYLAPRIDSLSAFTGGLLIVVGILLFIVLLPMAVKTIKSI